jgi:TonB family protein
MEHRCHGEMENTIAPHPRTVARILSPTPFLSVVAAALLALLLCSGCQGQSPKSSIPVSGSSPSSSSELGHPTSIVLELNRAVAILKQGMAETWGDRDRYLSEFEKTPNVDSLGRPVTGAKSYVECVIDRHFRNHEVWDEGVPIDAEARLTVIELVKLRESEEKADGFPTELNEPHLPPCVSSEHSKIVISAGVATALLKIKIDPIYPVDALKHNVSGTVTLHATIGKDGHVAALRIISGPDELNQAALNAVRQWTYQPYQLNGGPVEVETTISVPFGIHR